MATAQLNRARTVKKLEKPRPLKLNQRNSTVDGRITTGTFFIEQNNCNYNNNFTVAEEFSSILQ